MAKLLHYFPEEICYEILQRLPSKSLCRFLSVSKAWYKLITSQAFKNAHLNQNIYTESNNHVLIRFLVDEENYMKEVFMFYRNQQTITGGVIKSLGTPSFVLKLNGMINLCWSEEIIGSCNGLVCMMAFNYHIVLFNPSIRKLVELPPFSIQSCMKKMRWEVFGFGVNLLNGDFKVVRVFGGKKAASSSSPVFVEVYSLETRKWVEINGVYDHIVRLKSPQVYVNGCTHWIAICKLVDNQEVCGLVAFDLSHDVFNRVLVPEQLAHCMDSAELVTMTLREKECIAIVIKERTGFRMWVMKEYGVLESWTNMYSYNVDMKLIKELHFAGFSKNGHFFMVDDRPPTKLTCYDPVSELVSNLNIRGFFHHVEKYIESLVLLDHDSISK